MTRLTKVMVIAALFAASAAAQAPKSHYDPMPSHPTGQQQKSFIEWAFGQINPRNVDYGARIEEMRQGLLDDTLGNPGWRLKAALIVSLLGLFIGYWWEVRRSGNMQVSTARIITVYHNELATARSQIAKLTTQYSQAKRILDDHMEAALAAQSQKNKPANSAPAGNGGRANAANNGSDKPGEQRSNGHDGEPNQQLLDANQTISSLRRQVNTLTKKYEEEQQRNRKLKGE